MSFYNQNQKESATDRYISDSMSDFNTPMVNHSYETEKNVISSRTIKKWIIILVAGTFLFLLLSIIYESLQAMFLVSNVRNGRASAAKDDPTIQTFIDSFKPNSVGLWKQCNAATGCEDLQLTCGKEDVLKALQTAGLLVLANPEQTTQFVDTQSQLCSLFTSARVTSIFAIVLSALTLVALVWCFQRNTRIAFWLSTTGSVLMIAFAAATMGILITIKNVLDTLAGYGSKYSSTGSNTSNAFVDTVYAYDAGFWLVVTTLIISILLLPMFLIVSRYARTYREAKTHLGSEYGSSIGTFSRKLDEDAMSRRFSYQTDTLPVSNTNEAVLNQQEVSSVSYELPPGAVTTNKNVKFSQINTTTIKEEQFITSSVS